MHSHSVHTLLGLCAFAFCLLTVSAVPTTLEARGKSLSCSVDTSTSSVTDWAMDVGFQASMENCLGWMNNDGFGIHKRCQPYYPDNSTDYNPRPAFDFWKAHSHNFNSGYDCYNVCRDCLVRGIRAGLAVTTYCHYQVKNVVSHTCEMGFDYLVDSEQTPRLETGDTGTE